MAKIPAAPTTTTVDEYRNNAIRKLRDQLQMPDDVLQAVLTAIDEMPAIEFALLFRLDAKSFGPETVTSTPVAEDPAV